MAMWRSPAGGLPSLLRSLAGGLRSLLRKEQVDHDLDEELRSYREMAIDGQMSRGKSREEASRAVRLERGELELAKEMVRASGWEFRVEAWWRDLRFGTRLLRKSPGFTIVAVGTLALGIGAATSIFSVVEAVLLRSLPYPNPGQIVQIWEKAPEGHRMNLADPNFEDFRTQNHTLSSLAEYAWQLSSVSGGSEPARVAIAAVSSGFFPSLGVAPVRGRGFTPDEQREHGSAAAIVSYGYWQRYLGGAADLSPFHLTMEGAVYPVVGVMPARFDFPPAVSAWIPREAFPMLPSRTAHNFHCLGRVRDGVTVSQARADLSAIARNIKRLHGNDVDLEDASVVPLAEAMAGDVRAALMTLSGAVGLLLLVACANVAGLLVARATARRKELAVRAALGAGQGRLIQQFVAESCVLSLAGGGLGVLIATWTVHLLTAVLVGSSRVDLQACKLEYSIVSPK